MTARKIEMLAVVRVVKAQVGMGLEFLDLDPKSHTILLAWIRILPKSRMVKISNALKRLGG